MVRLPCRSRKRTAGGAGRAGWGLATDHRRLFGALADGWLQPLQSRAGVLIGVGAYAVEPGDAPGGHPIAVRITLDAAKLPAVAVSVRRGERWVLWRAAVDVFRHRSAEPPIGPRERAE